MDNSHDFADKFRYRTKNFVIAVIKLYRELPNTTEAQIIGKQWLRCSSSVGANYRAACRARSQKEFVAKLSIVAEEADESIFWMEVMVEANIMSNENLKNLIDEVTEILKVVSKARKTITNKNS